MIINQTAISNLVLRAKVWVAEYGAELYDKYMAGDKTCDCHNKVYLATKWIKLLECYDFGKAFVEATHKITIPYEPIPDEPTARTFVLRDADGIVYTHVYTTDTISNYVTNFINYVNANITGWYMTKAIEPITGDVIITVYKGSCTAEKGIRIVYNVSHGAETTEGVCEEAAVNPCLDEDDIRVIMNKLNQLISK